MGQAAWDRAATEDETRTMQDLLRASMEAGAWGWSTTNSPTHAGTKGEPVPSRLAANEERVALGRAMGEFNRGISEILPPSITQPDEADRQHLIDVVQGQRPAGLLSRSSTPSRGAGSRRRRRRALSSPRSSAPSRSTRASR